MADDMGMGDTSAYQDHTGNADEVQLHTPHMERLARMGIRFTDAHTPSSRCSPTRYSLLTGRYAWRNRLKHWVLFGAQGDPMIEADRPTIAMLKEHGYATGMVGKWHVGLRYRRADGAPAAGWDDADLTKPLHTTPLDHGFDFARFTSRSHGTSGPDSESTKRKKGKGPGHVHGREVVAATGEGKRLSTDGPNAYTLTKLGSRHSDHAMAFVEASKEKPFFLYYAANANHGPYTPDKAIDGVPVSGGSRTKSGAPMDARYDYIFENDVALGRLLDWLENTDDPRNSGNELSANTLVIFTSDNGAEIKSKTATGPYRSNKGSVYEGGHRVPFIAAWPEGGVGDGDTTSSGQTNAFAISLTDLFATIAAILEVALPDVSSGEKGAEDSFNILPALRGELPPQRPPLFFNDHSEAKRDRAACALRVDSPTIDGTPFPGQWKLFFDAQLIRQGIANPVELYNLAKDPQETTNLLGESNWEPLAAYLTVQARRHRNAGGHHLAKHARHPLVIYDWIQGGLDAVSKANGAVRLTITHEGKGPLATSPEGLGIQSGESISVDSGEALLLQFDQDVLIESVTLKAGDGHCGGFYQLGKGAPLAIYCIDADNDANDQSGVLSDLGVLPKGQILRLDSSPHFGVEVPGAWHLQRLCVRPMR